MTTTTGPGITPEGWPTGKISEYGGPNDPGARNGSLPVSGGTPAAPPGGPWYIAMRWPRPYGTVYPTIKPWRLLVTGPKGSAVGYPADWGPARFTGRMIDVSPELMRAIGAVTDDTVTVAWAPPGTPCGPVAGGGAAQTYGGDGGGLPGPDWLPPIFGPGGIAVDAALGGDPLPGLGAVTALVENVMKPAFWRRVGLGAAGIAIGGAGVVIIAKDVAMPPGLAQVADLAGKLTA